VPRAYAYLHRAHHAYSDTEKDPHTPHRFPNAFAMMWETKTSYNGLVKHEIEPEPRFQGYVPTWPELDRIADSNWSRIAWGTGYTLFYIALAPHWAFFLLLPAHYLMGPIHGAIVNWAGHKYGYRNYGTRDMSRNVIPWDVVCLGELFQNNHHRHAQSANFGQRAFEWDPTYRLIRLFNVLGILDLAGKAQVQDDEDESAMLPVTAVTGRASQAMPAVAEPAATL
jgi:stearoyl-CoA desaturase (Delta-9 desaturase)